MAGDSRREGPPPEPLGDILARTGPALVAERLSRKERRLRRCLMAETNKRPRRLLCPSSIVARRLV